MSPGHRFHSGCPGRWVQPWMQAPSGSTTRRQALCFRSFPVTDSEDDGESEAAKQLIQPIAEKIIAKYKAKEEEAPLLFFVAGEVSAAWAGPGANLRTRVTGLRDAEGGPGPGVTVLLDALTEGEA